MKDKSNTSTSFKKIIKWICVLIFIIGSMALIGLSTTEEINTFDWSEVNSIIESGNSVRLEYELKKYNQITGTVTSFVDTCVHIKNDKYPDISIYVFLKKSDVINLNKGDEIMVEGKFKLSSIGIIHGDALINVHHKYIPLGSAALVS